MAKLPYMQFYVGDWLRDTAVRASSAEARALWIDLLCHMQLSPQRGYLANEAGKPFTVDQMARISGFVPQRVKTLLDELRENGVFSESADGRIFNRRMVREEQLSDVRRRAVSNRRDRGFVDDFVGTKPLQDPLQRSDADADADDASEARIRSQNQKPAAAAAALAEFPNFAAAAREKFSTVDDELLAELIVVARHLHAPITDDELTEAIRHATRPRQHSPALWRKTLPEVIKSWLR